MKLECIHIDTCLSCYFSGHHLPWVCIPVWRNMTLKEIKQSLLSELANGAVGGSATWEYLESDQWYRQSKAAVNRIKPNKKGQKRFFTDLEEQSEDDYDDSVYAFFVFEQAD